MVVGCHRSKGDPFSNPDRQKARLVAGCDWCQPEQQQTDPCGVTWVLGPRQGHCLVQVLVAGTNTGARSGSTQVHTPGTCTQHCSTLQVTSAQGQGPHRYTHLAPVRSTAAPCRSPQHKVRVHTGIHTWPLYAALQQPAAASEAGSGDHLQISR